MANWIEHTGPDTFTHPLTGSTYREPGSLDPSLQPPLPPPTMDDETKQRQQRSQFLLNKILGPDLVASRSGGGGVKLHYLEGWRAINIANDVFGYNGWYTDIKYLEADFVDYHEDTGRWSMGVTAIVRVRLQDGASHEDVGYGKMENTKSKADGLDKCKKEAVTDALKRALRHFGKLLGNCLYDKAYLQQIGKMGTPKPKFDWDSLYKPEQDNLPLDTPNPPWSPAALAAKRATTAPPAAAAAPKPVPSGGAAKLQRHAANPNPTHPPAGVAPNRSKTVATSGAGGMAPPPQPQQTKPPPHRAATVSHPSHPVRPVPVPVAAGGATSLGAPNPLDRSGAQTEFGMSAQDESLLAGIDLDGVRETSFSSEGDVTGVSVATNGTGRVYFEGDSGFGEVEELSAIKNPPHRPPPPPARNPPHQNQQHPPPPHPPTHRPSPEEAKLAAQARLAENQRKKEQQAKRAASVSAEPPAAAATAAGATAGSTSAAQLLRASTTPGVSGDGGGPAAPPAPLSAALGTARPPGLRPAQPPSRTNSLKASTSGGAQHPKVAGALPTLNVGAGIASRAATVGGGGGMGGGSGAAGAGGGGIVPAAGGAAGVSGMVSASPPRAVAEGGGGFVSARGVKRGVGEGYDPSPPAQPPQQLQRQPSNSHNNPSHHPFHPQGGGRNPLGELEVDAGTGMVKRARS
ncbi:hypothetical protein JCM6882_006386 [Rhodosporidiobolus microsporus]